jgi:hypothetical protein
MSSIPTSLFPLIFAVIAVAAGLFFARRTQNEPNSLVSKILYAVAIACVVLAVAQMALQ